MDGRRHLREPVYRPRKATMRSFTASMDRARAPCRTPRVAGRHLPGGTTAKPASRKSTSKANAVLSFRWRMKRKLV